MFKEWVASILDWTWSKAPIKAGGFSKPNDGF